MLDGQPHTAGQLADAVDDGSGMGFSLAWLNDKDGNLWKCDVDADRQPVDADRQPVDADRQPVYVYSILTGDLLEGAGGELIGLHLTADGDCEGEPQQIAETVCVAHLGDGGDHGRCWPAHRARGRFRLRHLRAERRRSQLSLQRQGRCHDLGVRAGREPAYA